MSNFQSSADNFVRRRFYSSDLKRFLSTSNDEILDKLIASGGHSVTDQQRIAWEQQILILKDKLGAIEEAHIAFEYVIPRMGKRVDVIVLHRGRVFVLEFKVGESTYPLAALNQALDYALDLKNFHQPSHNREIVPVVISTNAKHAMVSTSRYDDGVFRPIRSNQVLLKDIWHLRSFRTPASPPLDALDWLNGRYLPTPTIIEAAQALYAGHGVEDISRSGAETPNLNNTAAVVTDLVKRARSESFKAICFITGVPGSGKTLAGLNIASKMSRAKEQEDALFLSGNGPLVTVLQESLARDRIEQKKKQDNGTRLTKKDALREAKSFIQIIHRWRDDHIENDFCPSNHVTIFDEAQRAWTKKQTARFMATKKGIANFSMSEPQFLIDAMNRHPDWAVVVCLVGGGQEINTGEAGLSEWFDALKMHFEDWEVYVSDKLDDPVYTNGTNLYDGFKAEKLKVVPDLHLNVSIRSFRSKNLSEFVGYLLNGDPDAAANLADDFLADYPIVLTRDAGTARNWLRQKARGTESMGILASSGGYRLRPLGIDVKRKVDPAIWFLNDSNDVRSSDFLEDVATEFDVQGLELDWTCVAWDANLRRADNDWSHHRFKGTNWQRINKQSDQRYLVNSYRVLLTRARQGMVILIPEGSEIDQATAEPIDTTRDSVFYDPIFAYLKAAGIPVLNSS